MHFNSISSYRKALVMELVAQQIDFQFMQVCKLQLHSKVDNVGLLQRHIAGIRFLYVSEL